MCECVESAEGQLADAPRCTSTTLQPSSWRQVGGCLVLNSVGENEHGHHTLSMHSTPLTSNHG
eukprot:1160365-Pelagomonas_calceolata.AAC.7